VDYKSYSIRNRRYRRLQWFGHARREADDGVQRLLEEKECWKIKEILGDILRQDLEILG